MNNKITYTPSELAKKSGIPLETIKGWIKSGRLPSKKTGTGKGSRYRISPEDAAAILSADSQEVGPADQSSARGESIPSGPPDPKNSGIDDTEGQGHGEVRTNQPTWQLRKLKINSLKFLEDCQIRFGLRKDVVQEYCEAVKRGAEFHPILVVDIEGTLTVVDGHHRIEAHRLAGRTKIQAQVMPGTMEWAYQYALKANQSHGLRLTNKEKQRAIRIALRQFPEWTNTAIAHLCEVSEGSVRNHREKPDAEDPKASKSKPKRKVPSAYKKAKSAMTRIRCTPEDARKLVFWINQHYKLNMKLQEE